MSVVPKEPHPCDFGVSPRTPKCDSSMGNNGINPCRRDGRCTVRNGICVAGSDADCGLSEACRIGGRCGERNGACEATKTEHCKQADVCKKAMNCALAGGFCILTDEICRGTTGCQQDGKCSESGYSVSLDGHPGWSVGECTQGSDGDCARSRGCREEGLCGFAEGGHEPGGCAATSDEHCRESRACSDEGRCTRRWGRCVKSEGRNP